MSVNALDLAQLAHVKHSFTEEIGLLPQPTQFLRSPSDCMRQSIE